MKTVVLDANELSRDWLCSGLKYQLLEHMFHATWLSVYVPATVFEEVVANHAREVRKVQRTADDLTRQRSRLGLGPLSAEPSEFDFRAYLSERFDERLGFTVMPWPTIAHEEVVARSVSRTPPFNEKGSGYRDSLIWADIVDLARSGHQVAFVSVDKIFAGDDGRLSPTLQAEIEPLPGSVELVRDFSEWLIAELPWEVEDLVSAVNVSRDSEFYTFFQQSDLQDELVPTVEEMGFRWVPYDFDIVDARWGGAFTPVEHSNGPDGLTLVEYDLDQTVEFAATFPEGVEPEEGWSTSGPDYLRRVHVTGTVEMMVRIAVLFGGEFGFSVEQLSWRRKDGVPASPSVYRPELDPCQLSLLDSLDE